MELNARNCGNNPKTKLVQKPLRQVLEGLQIEWRLTANQKSQDVTSDIENHASQQDSNLQWTVNDIDIDI